MFIPKTFKDNIQKVFYDKSIDVLDKTSTRDAEGDIIVEKLNVIDNFMGNVSFSNFKAIKEEYGIDYQIDISITTSNDTEVNLMDLISYKGITYQVKDKIESDSHLLLVGATWE